MPTSAVHRRVSTLSGSKIPKQSVYQALRTLLKRKQVTARRLGRELTYRLVTRASAGPPRPTPLTSGDREVAGGAKELRAVHTLAVGEVALIEIGTTHVETATNVHGRLVLERHRRPK
ncbi:MAG: hypothetical protein L3J96_00430 [Thermoplasmata archaeon]|nr:hypothetical protein [Thermoplasmata archaeon]